MANPHIGSGIDDFLAEEGVLETFQAQAIKDVLAWQLREAMEERNLSGFRSSSSEPGPS